MAIFTNSNSNYVNFGAASQYLFTGSFTILGWVNVASSAAVKYILSRSNGTTGARCYYIYVSASGYLAADTYTASNTASGVVGETDITGAFHHVAYVHDIGAPLNSLYLDGALHKTGNTAASTYNNAAVPVKLGLYTSTAYLNGTAFDVRMYNRALSAAEIMSIYALRGKDTCVDGLVLRTAIRDGVPEANLNGVTIRDYSPFKNNVAATGSPTAKNDPFGCVRRPHVA